MGYLDFFTTWVIAHAIPPWLVAVIVPGTLESRTLLFIKYNFVSAGFLLAGLAIGFMSVTGGFGPGVLFAIWGEPLLLWIFVLLSLRPLIVGAESRRSGPPQAALPLETLKEEELPTWERLVKRFRAFGFTPEEVRSNLVERGLTDGDARAVISRFFDR